MRAVIVFAHGSRDPLWRQPVEAVATAIVRRNATVPALCAYLELCEPSLPDAAANLVAAGATEIRILPLFFGMGKHARADLPEIVQLLRERYPTVRFRQLAAAGEDPRLTALLADIALEDPAA